MSQSKTKKTYHMLPLLDLLPLITTRAWLEPTFWASSLAGRSRDCPAKVVEAHAVAAAIVSTNRAERGEHSEEQRARLEHTMLQCGAAPVRI